MRRWFVRGLRLQDTVEPDLSVGDSMGCWSVGIYSLLTECKAQTNGTLEMAWRWIGGPCFCMAEAGVESAPSCPAVPAAARPEIHAQAGVL